MDQSAAVKHAADADAKSNDQDTQKLTRREVLEAARKIELYGGP